MGGLLCFLAPLIVPAQRWHENIESFLALGEVLRKAQADVLAIENMIALAKGMNLEAQRLE